MAGLICSFTTAETTTGTGAKCLAMLKAPANQRLKLLSWSIAFDGTSVTAEPIQIVLGRFTTDGTMTAGSEVILTPAGADETPQAQAFSPDSVEPTLGDILQALECHPQGGYEKLFPIGQEPSVPGGGRIGVQVTAAEAVNARVTLVWEE